MDVGVGSGMTNSEGEEGPIMYIPEEVRGAIFNKLSQEDALKCRLVCQQWRKDIDNFFDFAIQLDERSPYLKWILTLRIHDCKVSELLEPIVNPTGGLNNNLLKHPVVVRMFDSLRYPGVRKKNFERNLISPANLHNILLSAAEHLQELRLCITMTILASNTKNFHYNFENLKTLEIWVDFTHYNFSNRKLEVVNFLEQLMPDCQTPRLKSFTIGFCMLNYSTIYDLNRLISTLLLYISKRRLVPLEVLNVSMHTELETSPPPLEVHTIKNLDISQIVSLKRIKFNMNPTVGLNCWHQLLANQTKLEEVSSATDSVPIPATLLRHIVLKNFETLVEIDIFKLDICLGDNEVERSFDMSVFQDCCNLKKLELRSGVLEIDGNDALGLVPCIFNLLYLPVDIKELALQNFKILTDDLMSFCSKSRDLRELTLLCCGKSGAFGITASVIFAIMGMESLEMAELKDFNLIVEDEIDMLFSIQCLQKKLPIKQFVKEFIKLRRHYDTKGNFWTTSCENKSRQNSTWAL